MIASDQLMTIGDLLRDVRLQSYSRRQIEYAIDTHRIVPIGRLGIIRAFSANQVPTILAALKRTAKSRGSAI